VGYSPIAGGASVLKDANHPDSTGILQLGKQEGCRRLSKTIIAALLVCMVMVDGCASKDVHPAAASFQAPSRGPKVLAAWMPWFGDKKHMDVGYSSQDTNVMRRQIQDALNRGISGFVVDWYGDRRPYHDKSFALLQQVASEMHFQVALMYDETENDNGQATDEAFGAFDKAYRAYIGPSARYRDAYLTYNGRPVVFIFPKRGRTDWNRIRAKVNTWSSPPLLIYKDDASPEFAGAFDGYYAWVHPGHKGWAPDGSDWGEQYLDNFYKNMTTKRADKIVVGAAWPGFDDSHASWGLNRHMDARCGETFEQTLGFYRRYYNDSNSIPFLLIETWNDYEEGTAVERATYTNCNRPS